MSFDVSDNKLLKNYKKIWEKNRIIEFDSGMVYGDKYINTKIRSYTVINGKGIPRKNAACNCLSLTVLEPVITASKKYHTQTFLECKYEVKKKKKWRSLLMI